VGWNGRGGVWALVPIETIVYRQEDVNIGAGRNKYCLKSDTGRSALK